MLRKYSLRDFNFKLCIFLLVLSTLGVLLVGSADSTLQTKQMLGVIGGFVIMLVIAFFDYSWVLHFAWVIYALNLILLGSVLVMGAVSHGATRWVQIGGSNGIQFQPTELSKILLILFFAMYIMKHEKDLNSLWTILKAVVLAAIPLGCIAVQPDLKNTITITMVFCIMMYVGGIAYKTIGRILLIVVPLGLVAFILITQTDLPILSDYQKERIMTFLDPNNDEYTESARQQNNSIVAIGSGQITGKGLNNKDGITSNNGNFVSEVQNDFIFAVAGEELGFVGSFAIIVLLFLIVFECIRTGMRAKDLAGQIICTGVASIVAIQSFINICVASGLLPNTGTPLPFVSYGLTSLISLYIGMGFVLNASLQRKKYPAVFLNEESSRRAA